VLRVPRRPQNIGGQLICFHVGDDPAPRAHLDELALLRNVDGGGHVGTVIDCRQRL